MPVAEAILSGCPVACSGTTSLPEIAGDAALLFDPANTEEIGAALIKICTDDILRDRLRKNGLRRQSALFLMDSGARNNIHLSQGNSGTIFLMFVTGGI